MNSFSELKKKIEEKKLEEKKAEEKMAKEEKKLEEKKKEEEIKKLIEKAEKEGKKNFTTPKGVYYCKNYWGEWEKCVFSDPEKEKEEERKRRNHDLKTFCEREGVPYHIDKNGDVIRAKGYVSDGQYQQIKVVETTAHPTGSTDGSGRWIDKE